MKKIYFLFIFIFFTFQGFSQDCSPIGWGNYQWPPSGIIADCNPYLVFARVWKGGVTELPGPAPTMTAWIGVSTENSPPFTWPESRWFQATYNLQMGNDDEYIYSITNLPIGNYFIASRFKNGCSDYFYGGKNGPWMAPPDFATVTTTVNCNLSLDEIEKSSISIYPNPTREYINILSDVELKSVAIFNFLGQTIQTKISENRIDISKIPNGNYILKITDINDKEIITRFLKY